MYKHAPDNYKCALCFAAQGKEEDPSLVKKDDVFYQDEVITGFISSYIYSNSPGHVVIIPNKHFENLYDLDIEDGHILFDFSRQVALALKDVLDAEGTSIQQHNEPAGNQHVFHYHMHIFPRFVDDNLYSGLAKKRVATVEEKKKLAEKLKTYFK